jgi:hypothetical protein
MARNHIPDTAALTEEASVLRMIKALDSSLDDVRRTSLAVLGMVPPEIPAPHVPAVIRMIRDPRAQETRLAASVLWGAPVSALIEHVRGLLDPLLDHETHTYQVCKSAADVLEMIPSEASAPHMAAVIQIYLHAPTGDMRWLQWWARSATNYLDASLLAPHASIIVEALGDSEADTRAIAPKMLKALLLSALAPASLALHAGALMRAAIFDAEREARGLAITCLGLLDVETLTEYTSVLLEVLDHGEADVRGQALDMFKKLPLTPSLASLALTVVRKTINDSDLPVRVRAMQVLCNASAVPPEEASALAQDHVLMLRDTLDCNGAEARDLALEVMGKLPPVAIAPHMAAVLLMMGDNVSSVREAAIRTLKKAEYAPLLLKASADKDAKVSKRAKQVLRSLPPAVLAGHSPEA